MNDISKINMEADLSKYFGFDSFRPGQKEAVNILMKENRVLCIQPTGHGKSILYQLPSLWIEGLTLVISPLLALMRDQLNHLNERFKIPAASINSDQTDQENDNARIMASQGRIRILFIAPEKLDNLETFRFLLNLNVGLLVVDEAHCISTWGHDFRPSYRQILNAVSSFEKKSPDIRVLGLTATAAKRTETDIAEQLTIHGGKPLKILRISMDRPNLRLLTMSVQGMAHKLAILEKIVRQTEGTGILYCATRETTEIVGEYLLAKNLDVISYHAGYDPEQKRKLQQKFMNGTAKAIAATNALGMGIDKPDIRFIVHVDVPGSITAYYQEVGRAGRDGLPSVGFLLFDEIDRKIQEHFIRSSLPTIEDFRNVYKNIHIDQSRQWPGINMIKSRSGLHPTKVSLIISELTECGLIEKKLINRRQVYLRTGKKTAPDLTRFTNQSMARKAELETMLSYGRKEVGCLMQTLRLALGDENAETCGHCSQCSPDSIPANIVTKINDPNVSDAAIWMINRHVPIPARKIPKMSEGLSLLNGDLRSAVFVEFMRHRASRNIGGNFMNLPIELEKMLLKKLEFLKKIRLFCAIIPIPSRTWVQKENTCILISDALGVPVYFDLLAWREMPAQRQGELFNNDQRRENVHQKMCITRPVQNIFSGQTILLLDDYTGSGATLKEAVRALRKQGKVEADIVPVTMARIRWCLGARGMV